MPAVRVRRRRPGFQGQRLDVGDLDLLLVGRTLSGLKDARGAVGRKGGRLPSVPLAAEFADPVANGAASDAKAIGDLGQRLLLDENRPKGLIPAMPNAGRLEKERRVGLAVHDRPPCNMSSIFPSYGRQYDMSRRFPAKTKNSRKPREILGSRPALLLPWKIALVGILTQIP